MKLIACKTPIEVAIKTLEELRRLAAVKKNRLALFVPTGSTPKPIYAAIVNEASFWSEKLAPIQIDEFVDTKRLFFAQLKNELLDPLCLNDQALLIDPRWTEGQMLNHIDHVLSSEIDVALLGLGPNGHVGFHEPGYPMSFVGGRLKVSEESRSRVVGATTSEVYTFGVQAFMRAREILLVVTGEAKREILRRVIEAEMAGMGASSQLASESAAGEVSAVIDTATNVVLPAVYLKWHKNLTIISDVMPA